jgi:signal transduction histidine kinase
MRLAHLRLVRPVWLRLPRRTARLRLTVLCGGLFLVSGVALVAITYVLFERATEYRTPHLPTVPHTAAVEHLKLPTLLTKPPAPPLPGGQYPLAQAFHVLGQAQRELTYPGPGQVFRVPTQLARVQRQLAQAQNQLAQGQRQLAEAVHQVAQTATVEGAQRASDSHQLLVNAGFALGVVAVLALLAAWLVAGRMLRPIRTITRTARRISSTSLHERLALDGPEDELKELGDTLDALFERLDAAFEAQRHFVANAAHELRTPLTAERALLQVALDDPDTTNAGWRSTANEVLASSDGQARLIEALLTLASSETGLDGYEPVDLAAAVTATLIDLQPEIDRLGLQIDEATTPVRLEGDPLLVQRLVANLLTNAVRHNIADGRVEVLTGIQEDKAVLSVTNTGPLIPPAEVERLFRPFQRLDRRRAQYKTGHGLGLSIVQAIGAAHQASISARPLPDGGLTVSVIFPPVASQENVAASWFQSDAHHVEIEIDRRSPDRSEPPGRMAQCS